MPGPTDDAIPDDIGDDVTPPAQEIPLPPRGANPFELLQYDVRLASASSRRVGQRLGRAEVRLRILGGEDGHNGKVGNLVATVGAWKKAVSAIAIAAVGSVALAIAAIYGAGGAAATERLRLEQVEQRATSNQAQIEQLKNEVLRLRFPSAFSPALGAPP